MNQLLYANRCKCKEKKSLTTKTFKKKYRSQRKPKPLAYPKTDKIMSKTFYIKSKIEFSTMGKFIFNSFQNKSIYYAIDDILYFLNSNPKERDYLLAILYSPIILLQNNFSVNFFDIWIREIYIDEILKNNRFLKNERYSKNKHNLITITFFYKTKILVKKQNSLW